MKSFRWAFLLCGALVGASPGCSSSPTPADVDGSGDARSARDAPADLVAGHQWVTIAPGTFTMGSPDSEPCRRADRENQHQVTLTRAFDIQTTEVTQGDFESLLGYKPTDDCPACPVNTLSWHEAAAYCNALSGKAGLGQCYVCSGSQRNTVCKEATSYSGGNPGGKNIYDCPGYRLPTEAEWEYAYRAGTTTAYYNGPSDPATCECEPLDATADKIGWYCGNVQYNQLHPVRQKQPNAWGLFDLAGNVGEWCNDWDSAIHALGKSPTTDPWGSWPGEKRVVRGGGLMGHAKHLRAAFRDSSSPDARSMDRGFRCAKKR